MNRISIEDAEISAARALRQQFTKFWSTASGTPREIYDQFISATPLASGASLRSATEGPGPGMWCQPQAVRTGRAILFLHGGGYGLGHASAYLGLASQLASRAQAPAFVLEYPLAPEATVPAARDLAVETLGELVATRGSVAVVGDSAGGGLSFATVLEARRRGIPVAAIVTFSPWTDLSLSGESARALAVADPLLDVSYLRASAAAYLGEISATHPMASPLFDPDLRLPPTLIQVGSDEVLLDDSTRMAKAVGAAGTQVTLEVWEGMHHVFQLNVNDLASARRALDHAGRFLEEHWVR